MGGAGLKKAWIPSPRARGCTLYGSGMPALQAFERVDVPEDMRQRDVRVAVSDNVMFFDAT
jgi:hypothetical protein